MCSFLSQLRITLSASADVGCSLETLLPQLMCPSWWRLFRGPKQTNMAAPLQAVLPLKLQVTRARPTHPSRSRFGRGESCPQAWSFSTRAMIKAGPSMRPTDAVASGRRLVVGTHLSTYFPSLLLLPFPGLERGGQRGRRNIEGESVWS